MVNVLALSDYWWGWLGLLFRWLHVIAAMAWIGASFYFIALDNHLEPPKDPRDAERGIGGEAWEVHGGGFYRVENRLLVAVGQRPGDLACTAQRIVDGGQLVDEACAALEEFRQLLDCQLPR